MSSTASQELFNLKKSQATWKETALQRQRELRAFQVRVRDLETSRETWKTRSKEAQTQLHDMEKTTHSMQKEIDSLKQALDEKEPAPPL